MTGTEGISSLKNLLGSLNVNETRQTGPVKSTGSGDATTQTGASQGRIAPPNQNDHASLSAGSLVTALGAPDSDVRTEKIAALQQAIWNGTYNVPATDIADKIVESLLG